MLKTRRTISIFPERLITERSRLGLTQEEFCRQENGFKFNLGTLKNLELGKTSPFRSTLRKLAPGYGISPEKLYELVAVPSPGERSSFLRTKNPRDRFDDALHTAAVEQGRTTDDVLENLAAALEANPKLRLTAARRRS